MKSEGGVRLALAIVLLVAVLAVVAWNWQRAEQTAPPVTASKQPSEEKARTPAPASAAGPRDALRERPERDRTSRPGEKQ